MIAHRLKPAHRGHPWRRKVGTQMDLTLHLGAHRTGSTTFQKTLMGASDALLNLADRLGAVSEEPSE